jgi:epoxyqueuosine reductase
METSIILNISENIELDIDLVAEAKLKDKIKHLAFELGFDDIGFAPYQLMKDEAYNYRNWIDNGYNATMEWMNNYVEIREDIRLLMEDTNSVIVLIHNYKSQNHKEDNYKISKYAWGDDYHNVLKSKLKKLCKSIESEVKENSELNIKIPDFQYRFFTDTGPILERQWAVKSGIGWQGKNGLLISKKKGSFVFISVILTNLKFSEPKIVSDYCGKCTKCIDSCPTNAIIQPKVIDANKCIAYWTIETRNDESFPKEIKDNLENWAFGCDICQDVCPWNNHRVPITQEVRFFPRNGSTNFNKNEILNINEEEFAIKFNNSPIKRAKFEGLKRNIKEL